MGKKVAYIFNIVLFLGLIAVLATGNLLQDERPTVSERENRALAAMPEFSGSALLSGEFTGGIDSFISDTFLLRESFIDIGQNVQAAYGFTGEDDIVLVEFSGNNIDEQVVATASDGVASDGIAADDFPTMRPDAFRPEDQTATDASATYSSNLIVKGNRIMEPFGFAPEVWQHYAEMINSIQTGFAGTNIRVISMIAPSSVSFYLGEEYKKLSGDQTEAIEYGYSFMNEDVITVDVYDYLIDHTEEYLYFRSDHHWTGLAAFYAHVAYMNETYPGERKTLPEYLEYGEAPGFLGYLYQVAPQAAVKETPDTVYYWHPAPEVTYTVYPGGYGTAGEVKPLLDPEKANQVNKYEIFLGGDYAFATIETDLDNGRVLMMTKDSYGLALAPWMANVYETVYVVDPRYSTSNLAELAVTLDVDDLLIFNNCFSVGNMNWHRMIAERFQF